MEKVDSSLVIRLNRILSSEYSIALLEELSRGLKVDDETIKKLGIERRTIYYILKEFRENGLVIKKGNRYMLSLLGFFVYNVENELTRWLKNRNEITLLNEYIGNSETFKVTNTLLKSLENIIGISKFEPVKVYTEWYSLVESLMARISTAEESVELASRYIDSNVLKAMLDAARRGIAIRMITDSAYSAARAKYYLALISNEENKAIAKQLFTLKNVSVKTTNVPYSFIIVDQEDVGIEIPDIFGEKNFLLGIQFKSPVIAEKVSTIMEKMYENAKQDSIIYALLQEVKD
ncbi:MAG: phospholipase D-like domain-containing protein [Nitrososphaeria archaeon]